MRRLYVEARIHTDLDTLWRHTQDPATHARWDGRFGRIEYQPGTDPQRFTYALFGVGGVGVTVGERHKADGTRTSALRFSSANPLSPIRRGAGHWRYVPERTGVRFLTGYDYEPGWGKAADLLVRPFMGWLTAWSFDRLRLWLERGIPPERSRNQALAELLARAVLTTVGSAHSLLAGLAVAGLVLLIPPLTTTPAARRCLRSAPKSSTPKAGDKASAPRSTNPKPSAPDHIPTTLDLLEQP
ncbi:SRPBCC family protein [Kutzneria albida]|uniref:SRPBCC family protein n=1 Tax=Kutzneria albida DSM 43870 TaxID=1449976 RepID=W5W7N5_9PSEU|nr:SRPBCC family protein [Kutzneria albida]AHH97133.1 hypothetical protein KALB_3769 [Kutzneria albida DSM 43870]